MKSRNALLGLSLLLAMPLAAQEKNYVSEVWVADQGNGKYKNPILYADYSDPDACRVGDDFYMTSSSFNCLPGLQILHSCRRRSSIWAAGAAKSQPGRAGISSITRAGSRRRSHPVSSQNRAASPVAARKASTPSCSTSIHSPRYQCMRRRGRGCRRQKRVAFRRAI